MQNLLNEAARLLSEKTLQDRLDDMLERAFDNEWSDDKMNKEAQKIVKQFGKPGQKAIWDPGFGGSFKISE